MPMLSTNSLFQGALRYARETPVPAGAGPVIQPVLTLSSRLCVSSQVFCDRKSFCRTPLQLHNYPKRAV